MSLVKKFATVGSGTMLSRIFGFAREMMMAAALAAIILGAMAVYFAAAFGLGGADLGMIRRNVRRKGGAQGATEPSPDP